LGHVAELLLELADALRLRTEPALARKRFAGGRGELLSPALQEAARNPEVGRDLGNRFAGVHEPDSITFELWREPPTDPGGFLCHGSPRSSLAWLLSRCPLSRGTPDAAKAASRPLRRRSCQTLDGERRTHMTRRTFRRLCASSSLPNRSV